MGSHQRSWNAIVCYAPTTQFSQPLHSYSINYGVEEIAQQVLDHRVPAANKLQIGIASYGLGGFLMGRRGTSSYAGFNQAWVSSGPSHFPARYPNNQDGICCLTNISTPFILQSGEGYQNHNILHKAIKLLLLTFIV